MDTFNKLSLVAQYDDMCRMLNKLIRESTDEEDACIAMLEGLQKRWETRQRDHEREKEGLKSQVSTLEKEIKKLNRQLVESRSALVREADEKKAVEREKTALLDQIRQVRQLVEKESYGDTDAHRKRVIRCLDIERLSPIASDDSDDCVSGLDYDRTEEDVLNTDRDSMQTDNNDIECVRQQLQKYDAEKREKLAASNSTPNIKDHKRGATLSAKPTANMLKSISSVTTPVPNAVKPHTFISKKCFKPESCVPCGGKVGFYGDCAKCEVCGVISHPDCRDKCPLPCVKITAPNTRSRQKKVLISDYVNSDAVPKVPALVVHCCNEIERGDNIKKPGLYRASAHQKDIEDLMSKILKSKSGMPNLSNVEVDILTGVVKSFLQQLDESLITTTLWNHFAEALKLDSVMEAKTHMSYYISYDLPTANRDTIAFLMQHLHAIAKHSSENMMTTKNLAKALAPTIVGNSCRPPVPQSQIHTETKTQVKIMEILFEIDEDFWANYVPRVVQQQSNQGASSYGSRLLAESPANHRSTRTRGSRLGGSTLPTPKLKPLFS